MKIIDQNELNAWLSNHTQWRYEDPEIVFEHDFENFVNAFGFISKLAILMEKHDHHPTLTNTYGRVRLSMATHDAGNKITDRDLNLAEAIEELL
jgi:4a-hydroxytetrahydrobiopterin dehydratase